MAAMVLEAVLCVLMNMTRGFSLLKWEAGVVPLSVAVAV